MSHTLLFTWEALGTIHEQILKYTERYVQMKIASQQQRRFEARKTDRQIHNWTQVAAEDTKYFHFL